MSLPYKITQTAAAIWLGMQLTAGYIVAPILFHLLPKMPAGEIAGILFAITAICGLVIFGAAYAFFQTATCLPLLVGFGTLATLSL